MENALQEIKTAAEGLVFISESDHPLESIGPVTIVPPVEAYVKQWSGKDAGTPVATQTVDYFFRNHVKAYDPGTEPVAQRFIVLVRTLQQHLQDVKVYRVGTVQVDAYILGLLKDGTYAGLKTRLIET